MAILDEKERSKVKVTGRQKPYKTGVMFTYGWWIRWWHADLALTAN